MAEDEMAVAIVFEVSGEPDELISAYEEALAAAPIALDQPARLFHVCFRRDDGICMVDVWASLEAFEAMYDEPTFREALRGTGQQPTVVLQVWPLHNLLAGPALAPSPTPVE